MILFLYLLFLSVEFIDFFVFIWRFEFVFFWGLEVVIVGNILRCFLVEVFIFFYN